MPRFAMAIKRAAIAGEAGGKAAFSLEASLDGGVRRFGGV
jgi:hypothetical protein